MGILNGINRWIWISLNTALLACSNQPTESSNELNPHVPVEGQVIVDIEGTPYSTVRIGTQIWMAQNLRTSRYRNGDPIPNVQIDSQWGELWNMGAWAHYENNTTYEVVYGKLYNGFAVMDQRGLCPAQWRVPTANDWDVLVGYLGSSEAGKKLKSATGWSGTGNGTNTSKFNGLPSGLRWDNGPNAVRFINSGTSAMWWSSGSTTSSYFVVRGSSDQARMEWYSFTSGAAVRCVKE